MCPFSRSSINGQHRPSCPNFLYCDLHLSNHTSEEHLWVSWLQEEAGQWRAVMFCSGYLCLPTPLILTLFRVPIMGHMFSFLFTNSISIAQGETSRAGLLTPRPNHWEVAARPFQLEIVIILGNPPRFPTWTNSLDGSRCCPVPFRSALSGPVQCQALALPMGKWAIKHDRVLTPWGPSLGRATGWHFRHDERPQVPALFSSCLSTVTGGRAFCYSMRLRAVCF